MKTTGKLVTFIFTLLALVVSAYAQTPGTRAQRSVQAGCFRTKKRKRADGCEAGEMAGPSIIGDKQFGGMKQHQQFANAAGVAGQVSAPGAADSDFQSRCQLGIFAQANQAHAVARIAQAACHPGIVFHGPGAFGEQSSTRIEQDNFATGQGGVIGKQFVLVRCQFSRCKVDVQFGLRGQLANGRGLVSRHAGVVQCINQRQKLLGDVLVRVVRNGVVDVAATVQAFLCVRGEAHSHGRAHQIGHQAADAREQFAIDDGIQLEFAHGAHNAPDVLNQLGARAVIERMKIVGVRQLQQLGHFLVALELQHMQRGSGVTLAQGREHGPGQHNAAHFGQQNHQDVFGLSRQL